MPDSKQMFGKSSGDTPEFFLYVMGKIADLSDFDRGQIVVS